VIPKKVNELVEVRMDDDFIFLGQVAVNDVYTAPSPEIVGQGLKSFSDLFVRNRMKVPALVLFISILLSLTSGRKLSI
jgi:hypothetical protein